MFRGSFTAGSLITIQTYEAKSKRVPAKITSAPAIFFLTRKAGAWRPFADFGTDRTIIGLTGFPDRPLNITPPDVEPPSDANVTRALIEGFLDPQNALDWPKFADKLSDLAATVRTLARYSGVLAKDPFLITDRLTVLATTASAGVAKAARHEIAVSTGLCNQTGETALEWARIHVPRNPLTQAPPIVNTPEDRASTYWQIKALTCSNLSQERSKAEALLKDYFPDRHTVGCEICP